MFRFCRFRMAARCARRSALLLGVVGAVALVYAGAASAADFIDPNVVQTHPAMSVSATEGRTLDNFGVGASERARDERLLGFTHEDQTPTEEEAAADFDLCAWAALIASAYEISDGDSPGQVLFNNFWPCLAKKFPGASNPLISNASSWFVTQTFVHLVQSQSPSLSADQALQWLHNHGLTYDPSTWSNWFMFMAKNWPPSTSFRPNATSSSTGG